MSVKFPTYKLSDKQIRGIACIVAHEQGSIAGWFAEASQIANRTDIMGDQYATPARAVQTVCSGWYAHGKTRYEQGTTNPVVCAIVRRVFIDGYRTLPRYINEHDCMSDISTVKDGGKSVKSDKSKWKRHTTVIHNRMSSTYWFWDFPGGHASGVDPFGYTSQTYRKKWGDFCYTIEETWEPVARIIAFAKNEVGYLEKRSNSSLTSKTANAGSRNYTKYGEWIGANGDYWCASFISWLFYQAFTSEVGRKLLAGAYSAACETIRQNFIKKDRYHTFLTGAKKGDVIFFKGTRHDGANHIGLIYRVKDGVVCTIEGNTSGASGVVDNGGGVAKKSYKTTETKVLGYGRPDYGIVYPKKTASTPSASATSTEKTETSVYYKKYTGKSKSIVDALGAVGVADTSLKHRTKIAKANGIANAGTVAGNNKMLALLKAGKLKKG